MLWFKHRNDLRRSPQILRAEQRLGEVAYGRFSKICEVVSQYGGTGADFQPRLDLNGPAADYDWLANELGISTRDLRKTLRVLAEVALIGAESLREDVIAVPILANLLDEATQRGQKTLGKRQTQSGVNRDESRTIPAQEVEVEVEVEAEKEKQTPLASGDAGAASQPQKQTDPRFRPVKDYYTSEFEKQNPGVKAVFDGSDGKALNDLLQRQPDATAETINRWLRNAFKSDDVPPLRKGFRFRQFASFHTQYVKGALSSDGVKPFKETLSLKERERRRNYLSPEARRLYASIGVRPQ